MSFPVAILCEDAQVDIIELEPGNWLAKAINGRLINKALSRGVSFEVSGGDHLQILYILINITAYRETV